jgi:hypothetical protein
MSVRAKFKVTGFESSQNSIAKKDADGVYVKDAKGNHVYDAVEMRTVKLAPVYGNGDPNHENTKFWQASPSGEIRLGTVNPEAWQAFELGKEYYVDFTVAE